MRTDFRSTKGLALVIALALALGGVIFAGAVEKFSGNNPAATLKLADPNAGPSRTSFAPVVKKALPAVVSVASSKVVKTGLSGSSMDPFFRQFFGDESEGRSMPRERRQQGLGSGVIVSPEGYILTNNHVVDGASDVRIMLGDKRELKARVVGTDARSDLALLKVDASGLPVITIADSSKAQVGDYVLAIGNPFGVGQTVTMGIVSAKSRGGLGIEEYEDFIQTDAPINPGNSGGALVNDRGELIGINTAILSRAGGNQGVGFAIPSNQAREVMDQLLHHGKVTRAYLGILPQDVTPAMAKAFGVTETRGALVGDVTPDGPASRAGLQKGDIITQVNGKPVEDANQLRMSISMMPPDATVAMKIVRNGATREVSAKLAEFPSSVERAEREPGSKSGSSSLDGISVEDLDAQTMRQLHLPAGTTGVVVTEISPSSTAASSGLRPGDVIQEVNRKPVKNVAEFEQAMRSAGPEPLLLANRQGNTLYIAL